MPRFFSPLGILCFLCISHLLILLVISDESDNLGAHDVCDSSISVIQCMDLHNRSSPLVGEGPCAVSERFLKSHCSSDQLLAYWDAFENATNSTGKLLATVISGVYSTGQSTYINLIWNLKFVHSKACDKPFAAANVDDIIPEVINLSTFANGVFQFSSYNYFVLFNCNNLTLLPSMANVEVNSTLCQLYLQYNSREIKSCVQLKPFQELTLHKALDSLSCTHFHSLVNNTGPLVSDWSSGMVQLLYGDANCEACFNSGGQCIFHKTTHIFEQCFCGEMNHFSKTVCQHLNRGCNGFSCNNGVKIATGLAVALGTTLVSLVLLTLCWPLTRKYFFPKQESMAQEVLGSNHSLSHLDLDGLTERSVEYSYASIVSATNSFRNLLGEGGFGAVYKGTLTHSNDDLHMQIAVKVLQVRSKHSKKQFLNEVATIGRIHSVHVVRLLGFCVQQSHEMLVYEYVINGSLDNWLFNHNQVLHWGQRYAIAMGIAKGLSYLHEECRHRIVHCDIKPQNILLDGEMCPKIADFGLAKLMGRDESRVATLARGTPGYMAPEFWMGGESQLSTKFDVYSYGMVLLEMLSGRRNFSDGFSFPEVAFEAAMRGDFESIMDARLGITKPPDDQSMKLDGMQWQQFRTALIVALWCIQDHPMSRPSMSEVVQFLEGKAAIHEQPPPPSIASTLSISAQRHLYLSEHHHYNITQISEGR